MISSNRSDTLKAVSFTNVDKKQIKEVFSSISKLSAIDKIQIMEGQIIWLASDDKAYPVVEDLNGWLIANDLNDMSIEAQGCLFTENDDNFYLNSQLDFENSNLNASILIKDYKLSSNDYPFIPEKVRLDSGIVTGTIHLQNTGFTIDSTVVNGELKIAALDISYADYVLSDLNLNTKIDTNAASIYNTSAFFAGARSEISGYIKDILNPKIVTNININDVPINKLTSNFNIGFLKNSRLNSSLHLEYGEDTKLAELKAWNDKLSIGDNYHINEFKLTATIIPDNILINKLSGIFNDFAFLGDGYYKLQQNSLAVNLGFRHIFGHHVLLDRLTGKHLDFDIGISMNTGTGLVNGLWDYMLVNKNDTLLAAKGNIKGDRDRLNVSLLNSNHKNLFVNIEIANYLKNLSITNARIVNFPFSEFTTNAYVKNPVSKVNTDIRLSGSLNKLNGSIDIFDKNNYQNQFSLNTNIENLLTDERNYSGKILLKNLAGDFRMLHKADFFGGAFSFSDKINGFIKIDLKEEDQLAGEIEFNKFKFIQSLADSVNPGNLRDQAVLDGTIKLSGTLDLPKLETRLFADKLVLNDVGYYQAEANVKYSNGLVSAESLIFYLNNLPVIEGNLTYATSDRSISGLFEGKEIDIDPIIKTIRNHDPFIKGIADYNVNLSGYLKAPKLEGNLQILEGELRGVPFDHLKVAFTDSVKDSGSISEFKDHFLVFHDLDFESIGRYHLSASGIIPVSRTAPLNVQGEFDGDLLSFIPRLHDFFLDGTSIAKSEFNLEGTLNKIRLKSGYAEIEKGELWLDKVVPHIENIHGRIEVFEGTNQINFKKLQAEVDGEVLTINTVRDVELASGEILENWYFKGTDLDFGILQLETTGRGIAVNIPGLMLEEDIAYLSLNGMNTSEKFYFAGPTKHPRLRGQLELYDTRFTFPFLISEKPGSNPSVVVEFLENIDWDVLAKSGEDVVYFREIPAYIDKVYTEVYIDESSEGIHFKGILDKGNFQPIGYASSSRGRLEYLDQTFRVDRFDVEFSQNDLLPYVSGRAWTTIRDSVGAVPKTIYLQLYVIDPETGEEKQQGSWEDFKFKLVSADPELYETQEQVLAYLGFSVGNMKDKATSVGGAVTERYLIRPLLRPVERVLEKSLGVDLVRINSNIAKNLFYGSLGSKYDEFALSPFEGENPYLFIMQSSELTLGKYLSQDLYLSYTGQLVSFYERSETAFDINHSIGLEYRFLRNVLLEIEYDRELMGYLPILNEKQYLEDIKIRLRHSFAF